MTDSQITGQSIADNARKEAEVRYPIRSKKGLETCLKDFAETEIRRDVQMLHEKIASLAVSYMGRSVKYDQRVRGLCEALNIIGPYLDELGGEFVTRLPFCEKHRKRLYNERYDAFYCPECVEWLSPECDCPDGECKFKGRPERPKVSGKEEWESEDENNR